MSSKKSVSNVSKEVSTKESVKDVSKKTTTKEAPKPVVNLNTDNLERDMQVIPIESFDFSSIIYSEPANEEIPGGGKARRVKLNYNYGDGKFGPICVQPGRLYSYGVQPNNVDKDGKILVDESTGQPKALTGYKTPLVMTSKEPTEAELANIEFFDNLKFEFQRYATENKAALGKASKSDEAVSDQVSDILFRKKENDEVVAGVAPKLYPSLLYYHKKKDMQTVFYGEGDKPVNPLEVEGAFYMEPTIKIESLWVAAKSINPQVKVYDATIEPVSRGPRKRLAPAGKAVKNVDGGDAGDAGDGDNENGGGAQSDGE